MFGVFRSFCIWQLSGVVPPPLCRNLPPNPSSVSADNSPKSTVNSTIQAPRRKFVDEGKLRKVSINSFLFSLLMEIKTSI